MELDTDICRFDGILRTVKRQLHFTVVDEYEKVIITQYFFSGVRKCGFQFAENCCEIKLWTLFPKANQFEVQVFTHTVIHLDGLPCSTAEEEIFNAVQLCNISEHFFR